MLRGFLSPVIGSPKAPEKPRVYPPSPGLLHMRQPQPGRRTLVFLTLVFASGSVAIATLQALLTSAT